MSRWDLAHAAACMLLILGAGQLSMPRGVTGEPPPIGSSTTGEPEPSTSIAQSVSDLSSQSRATRAAAEQALIRGGAAVLDQLPMLSSIPDPAVRDSLDRVIREIERSESATALQARRVNLHEVDSWLAAVERLSRESGNHLTMDDALSGAVYKKFPAEPMTFWEGVGWFESEIPSRYSAGRLFPIASHQGSPSISLDGPFRVELLDQAVRTTPSGDLLRVKVRLQCENRLRPLFLMAAVDNWTVSDDEVMLAPYAPGSRLELSASREGVIDVAFDFCIPDGHDWSAGTWTIAGELELTLAARSSMVVFSDLSAKLPITRRRGQATLSLLSVQTLSDSTTIRVASAYPQLSGLFESYRASLLAPDLTLQVDPETPALPAAETSQIQADPEGLVLDFQFPRPLSPTSRLHATLPTTIATQKISFRFESIAIKAAD